MTYIRQGKVSGSLSSFKFLEKYGLDKYSDPKKPAVFFGCYPFSHDQNAILAHKSLAVVVWCGTDGQQLTPRLANKLKADNIRHVVTSPYNVKNLKRHGLKFTKLPITPIDIDKWYDPKPLGPDVYMYIPTMREKFYGIKHYNKLQSTLPIIRTTGSFSQMVVRDMYRSCFIGLRLTPHDGMPTTVVEMGLMGRRCLWNGDLPNAIPWTPDTIYDLVMAEKKMIGQTNLALADQMYNYLNIGTEWLEY